MSEKGSQFTSHDILEKDFKTVMRGYKQVEVDEFLDEIIEDYDFFQQEINKLKQEIESLKATSATQKISEPAPVKTSSVNYDVLKRLSHLEKAVFGPKQVSPEDEQEIHENN